MARFHRLVQTSPTVHKFEPVSGDVGAPIFILNQRSPHQPLTDLLRAEKLRALEDWEALPLIIADRGLQSKLEGKRIWLAGIGIESERHGLFTLNADLEQVKAARDTHAKYTIRICNGRSPQSLGIYPKDHSHRWRYLLTAIDEPGIVGPRMVGVRRDWQLPKELLKEMLRKEMLRE